MTRMPTGPMTVRALLCDDGAEDHAAETIGRLVSEQALARPALKGAHPLSAPAARTVDREIGAVAAGLLDLDLGDVLVSCWKKHRSLVEAARATESAPGTEEVVDLVHHSATATYSPHVDLFVDEVKVGTVELTLSIVFDVTGVAAVVRRGSLVALCGGDCDVTATLTLEGVPLKKCHRHVDPSVVVPLHRPIRLVDEPATAGL